MPFASSRPPELGQLVNVRQRRYVVSEVMRSALPYLPLKPTIIEAQHLVSLVSVEDDALGEELQVIWELEPGASVIEKVALPEPSDDAESVRCMFKFERDLAKQVRELMEQLQKTKRALRLAPENMQQVVEVALKLAGQPPLIPANVEGVWPSTRHPKCPVFHLPALTGSWGLCADGLAHPLFRDQMRPFTFDHRLARGREDLVLVHLNHRLVQMSLRLLRAEVGDRLPGRREIVFDPERGAR